MKNIFTAALIATSILCVADAVKPQEAKANGWSCNRIGGSTSCYNFRTGDRYNQNSIGGFTNGSYYNNRTRRYGHASCTSYAGYTNCF